MALDVVLAVALDSVPPQRRAAYDCVCKYGDVKTADVAVELGLPTNTARRILEDLAAYRLLERRSLGQGHADEWARANWEAEE
jgi:predicted ArsR family transcriptional regulator